MSLNFFFSSLESMTKADEGIQYEGVGAISGGNCAKVALSSEPEVDVKAGLPRTFVAPERAAAHGAARGGVRSARRRRRRARRPGYYLVPRPRRDALKAGGKVSYTIVFKSVFR